MLESDNSKLNIMSDQSTDPYVSGMAVQTTAPAFVNTHQTDASGVDLVQIRQMAFNVFASFVKNHVFKVVVVDPVSATDRPSTIQTGTLNSQPFLVFNTSNGKPWLYDPTNDRWTNLKDVNLTNEQVVNSYNAGVGSASSTEMSTGTETAVRRMSPLNVAQAIAALAPTGSKVNTTTVDPSSNDGVLLGYSVNSVWTNRTTDESFICVDSTVGSAIWKSITTSTAVGAPASHLHAIGDIPSVGTGYGSVISDNSSLMAAISALEVAIENLAGQTKNELSQIVAPSTANDSTQGFSKNSFWINTAVTPHETYRCVDASVGAAMWVKTSLSADELSTVAISGNSDNLTEGSNNLLLQAAERTKLAGIASNSHLLDRANHTGTQVSTTISDFAARVNSIVGSGGGGGGAFLILPEGQSLGLFARVADTILFDPINGVVYEPGPTDDSLASIKPVDNLNSYGPFAFFNNGDSIVYVNYLDQSGDAIEIVTDTLDTRFDINTARRDTTSSEPSVVRVNPTTIATPAPATPGDVGAYYSIHINSSASKLYLTRDGNDIGAARELLQFDLLTPGDISTLTYVDLITATLSDSSPGAPYYTMNEACDRVLEQEGITDILRLSSITGGNLSTLTTLSNSAQSTFLGSSGHLIFDGSSRTSLISVTLSEAPDNFSGTLGTPGDVRLQTLDTPDDLESNVTVGPAIPLGLESTSLEGGAAWNATFKTLIFGHGTFDVHPATFYRSPTIEPWTRIGIINETVRDEFVFTSSANLPGSIKTAYVDTSVESINLKLPIYASNLERVDIIDIGGQVATNNVILETLDDTFITDGPSGQPNLLHTFDTNNFKASVIWIESKFNWQVIS